MYGSPFGYGGSGLGFGGPGFGFGQQDPYGYSNQGYGLGQQGSLFGGYQSNSNIDTGSKLGNALLALGNILGQVGNIAIASIYARRGAAGAFGGGLYAGFNPYSFSSPYGATGFGATGFGYNGGSAYPPNFGQYGYGNSFRSV